jgi:hypothetical protein
VTETVDAHGDKIESAVDKAATFVDEKTKGKYSEKITAVADKAKETVEKLGSEHPQADPPAGQPPSDPV